MLLAIKGDVVKLSLGLPHVLHLQLKKCRPKRARSEAHWISTSARARKGLIYTRFTLPQQCIVLPRWRSSSSAAHSRISCGGYAPAVCTTRSCDVHNDGMVHPRDAMMSRSEANEMDLCEVSVRASPSYLAFSRVLSKALGDLQAVPSALSRRMRSTR